MNIVTINNEKDGSKYSQIKMFSFRICNNLNEIGFHFREDRDLLSK